MTGHGAGPRANRLLAALKAEDFQRLEPCLEPASLSAGVILYEAGDLVRHAYFPHDSMVSLVVVLQSGGSAEAASFGREGVAGFVSSIASRQAFGRYVVVASGSASRIAVDRLQESVEASPSLRGLLRRFTEALLAQTLQIAACNAVHSVEARCCRWLLSMHDRVGLDDLPLTHELLAEMLGVRRSTLSLAAQSLQRAGLIGQHRGAIAVEDRAGLEKAACECYGSIRRSFERLLPPTSAGV